MTTRYLDAREPMARLPAWRASGKTEYRQPSVGGIKRIVYFLPLPGTFSAMPMVLPRRRLRRDACEQQAW